MAEKIEKWEKFKAKEDSKSLILDEDQMKIQTPSRMVLIGKPTFCDRQKSIFC